MPGEAVSISWQLPMLLRLLVAAALGAIIGLEREHHGRSAGLRTQLLVALGAATAMVVALGLGGQETAKVVGAVMGGIGFIGAGTIIHLGVGVRGLTTAASLWCSAAVGLAAGLGMHIVAAAATVLVLFALEVLAALEAVIPARESRKIVITVPEASPEAPDRYRQLLVGKGVKVTAVNVSCDFQAGRSMITFHLSLGSGRLAEVVRRLRDGAPEILTMTIE